MTPRASCVPAPPMDPPLDTRSSGASPGPPMPGIADQVRVADSQRRAVLARDVRRVRDTAYAPPHHPAKPRLAQRAAARSAAHPPWPPLISLSASHAPQSRRCMGASSRRRRRAGRARTLERGPRAMLRHWAASLTPPSSARRTRVFLLHRIDAVGYVCNMNELHRVCIQRARSAAVTTAAPAHRTPARFNLAESVIWEHPPRQSQDAPTITGRVPPGASGPCPACRRVIFCATGALLEAPER